MDKQPLKVFLKEVERKCVLEALETTRCAKMAADELGITYNNLRVKVRRHGLKLTDFHSRWKATSGT